MRPFIKSVLFGAFAGAAPMLIITSVIAIGTLADGWNGGSRFFAKLWIGILPLVISLPLVLGASIVVGLPLTAVPKRSGRESESAYIFAGAIVGFALPIMILMLAAAPAGYWMAALGSLAGAVTGRTWWISGRKFHASNSD